MIDKILRFKNIIDYLINFLHKKGWEFTFTFLEIKFIKYFNAKLRWNYNGEKSISM